MTAAWRPALWAAAFTALLTSASAGPDAWPDQLAGRLSASGVQVTVTLAGGRAGLSLVATFRPLRPGFHVYSIDLPAGGVQGLGIPTRVDPAADLHTAGRAIADADVRLLRLAALDVDLPVYPDGAVAVTLPVRQAGPRAAVRVTYAACSQHQCLPPVHNALIPLTPTA